MYVEFSDETETVITGILGGLLPEGPGVYQGEIEDDDPRYIAYINRGVANVVRNQRDTLLRTICDPGILMAQRFLRMAETAEEIAYAEGKIAELDIYAAALQAVPDQEGFPNTIIWPTAPTR